MIWKKGRKGKHEMEGRKKVRKREGRKEEKTSLRLRQVYDF
jgi:hypothetical protein